MKRIVVIYGHHDCGKSETLNFLRELIRNEGGKSLSKLTPNFGDVSETFDFREQIVCVCPGGDTAAMVRSNFDYAYSVNADIIITASRTRGDSVAVVVDEGRKNSVEIEWLQKSYENFLSKKTQTLCNHEYAVAVMRML